MLAWIDVIWQQARNLSESLVGSAEAGGMLVSELLSFALISLVPAIIGASIWQWSTFWSRTTARKKIKELVSKSPGDFTVVVFWPAGDLSRSQIHEAAHSTKRDIEEWLRAVMPGSHFSVLVYPRKIRWNGSGENRERRMKLAAQTEIRRIGADIGVLSYHSLNKMPFCCVSGDDKEALPNVVNLPIGNGSRKEGINCLAAAVAWYARGKLSSCTSKPVEKWTWLERRSYLFKLKNIIDNPAEVLKDNGLIRDIENSYRHVAMISQAQDFLSSELLDTLVNTQINFLRTLQTDTTCENSSLAHADFLQTLQLNQITISTARRTQSDESDRFVHKKELVGFEFDQYSDRWHAEQAGVRLLDAIESAHIDYREPENQPSFGQIYSSLSIPKLSTWRDDILSYCDEAVANKSLPMLSWAVGILYAAEKKFRKSEFMPIIERVLPIYEDVLRSAPSCDLLRAYVAGNHFWAENLFKIAAINRWRIEYTSPNNDDAAENLEVLCSSQMVEFSALCTPELRSRSPKAWCALARGYQHSVNNFQRGRAIDDKLQRAIIRSIEVSEEWSQLGADLEAPDVRYDGISSLAVSLATLAQIHLRNREFVEAKSVGERAVGLLLTSAANSARDSQEQLITLSNSLNPAKTAMHASFASINVRLSKKDKVSRAEIDEQLLQIDAALERADSILESNALIAEVAGRTLSAKTTMIYLKCRFLLFLPSMDPEITSLLGYAAKVGERAENLLTSLSMEPEIRSLKNEIEQNRNFFSKLARSADDQ